jgi:hypothetical protein
MGKSANSKTVVARMTVTRADNSRMIVEIHSDATFSRFYHFYCQQGNRRSTKQEIRVANRNTGLPQMNAHLYDPGLEAVASLMPVGGIKFRILRRRMYRQLCQAAPDVLGLVKATSYPDPRLVTMPTPRFPLYIPSTHTTIERKWSILNGRGR